MMRDLRDVFDTTDSDMLHYTRGIVCHILDTPESFRAFAAVALRLLLVEEIN